MDRGEYYPLYKKPGLRKDDTWSFHGTDEIHDVSVYAEDIAKILALANGKNSAADILKQLESADCDPKLADELIDDLTSLGVMVDSRDQTKAFHAITNNPPHFPRNMTEQELIGYTSEDPFVPREGDIVRAERLGSAIIDLGRERKSCRSFAKAPLSADVIMTCLDAAYAADIRPTPSAGGLYPLRLYAIVRENGSDIPLGYYQYDHQDQSLVRFNDDVDERSLKHIFNDEGLLKNAPVTLVIAANLERHTGKYANRGYRFTLLEAGHAAQNIALSAQELGANSLEYGGFQDEKLADELGMDENERPIITIALGHSGESKNHDISAGLASLERIVGSNLPIKKVVTDVSPEGLSGQYYYSTLAEYEPIGSAGKVDYALGAARSLELSRLKALAEAYERYISGDIRHDVVSPADQLKGEWLSPDTIRPLTDEQMADKAYLERFSPEQMIEWVKGYRVDGQPVLVPIELVYYPLSLDRKLVSEADSSGVAAHFNKEEAIRRGLLELLERDALMRLWMTKEIPDRIDWTILPEYFRKRNSYWQQQGRTTDVLDLSHDGIAIALVISKSTADEYPFFISGAAASIDSFEAALEKAYQEAEVLLLGALSEGVVEPVNAEAVHSPREHGQFYHHPKNKSEIEWLWQGPEKNTLPSVETIDKVIDRYDPIVVELTQDVAPLHVVRVICPELVPINFGFGNEYHTHPAIDLLNYDPTAPHFFA